MNLGKMQAWWFDRQGLASPNPALSSSDVLMKAGWARSVGGANPYSTLFARAGIRREQADLDLLNQAIHELPSARGCTYVVPKEDYALALTVGRGFSDESAMATARKLLGVTDSEVLCLMDKVLKSLAGGPLDPKQIKESVGDAARSLGEEGKKRGQSTTLPLALGYLQSQGRIRRIPSGGRLDQQRYSYALWEPSPLQGIEFAKEDAYRRLAEKYFHWAGPATLEHFRWFSGLGAKLAKEAVAGVSLIPLDDGFLIPEDIADEYFAFELPTEPTYALVASIDSHLLLRRDLSNLLLPADADRQGVTDRGLVKLGGLQDLSNHAILDRGRVVGIWEFDPDAQEVVWHSFVKPDQALLRAVAKTQDYIREDLGDFRSFSLDSPASRKPTIAALRELA